MQFIADDKGLTISIDDQERAELIALRAESEWPDGDDFLTEYMEGPLGNCEYNWCLPEDIGALTAAPLLCTRDEAGNVEEAYGFMDYAIESMQGRLAEIGKAWLQRG